MLMDSLDSYILNEWIYIPVLIFANILAFAIGLLIGSLWAIVL